MKGDAIFESSIAADALDNLSREELREQAHWISLKAGLKTFVMTSAVSVPATLAAIKYSPWFRRSTGTSGRVATAFMPAVFLFAFSSEQTASRLAHPEAYERYVRESNHVPVLKQIKDTIDQSPATFLIMAGVPVVGTIFYLNGRQSHLKFSQRVMHTRVMGQASVLALLSGVAFYHMLTDEPKSKH